MSIYIYRGNKESLGFGGDCLEVPSPGFRVKIWGGYRKSIRA